MAMHRSFVASATATNPGDLGVIRLKLHDLNAPLRSLCYRIRSAAKCYWLRSLA
ncbi:hypothetical protein SAMN06265222_12513 [Neorhodopirellula lusitana]|uniref:Uncharacterized protein n=1 Tax=Neorhodopirellula lusitana TaxID=445327 RepID=A0ABY1QT57_9BACT|nr:hypothetical protein SAMN06265222_12513 [Neorhodopirellula lusitana]